MTMIAERPVGCEFQISTTRGFAPALRGPFCFEIIAKFRLRRLQLGQRRPLSVSAPRTRAHERREKDALGSTNRTATNEAGQNPERVSRLYGLATSATI